jgi:hypothetical protein
MHPTTWVYLSSLLIIGIYFKFHRLFSVRNLDLLGLLMFSPGLLLVAHGQQQMGSEWQIQMGYNWLFVVSALFLLRLLIDPLMVRRPLLEPNLSASGLTFTGVALLVFLTANVLTSRISDDDLQGARRWEQVLARRAEIDQGALAHHGPGYPLFYAFADVSRRVILPDGETPPDQNAALERATTRTTAILGHLAVVLGIMLIGYRHFGNVQTGVAMASLYLLLPYTAQMTGQVDHVIPAALLVWAVASYRRPLVAGVLVGLAAGVIYYPIFLLPLWCSFYWRRGLFRFVIGVVVVLVFLVASLAFTSDSFAMFVDQLQQMFGWTSLSLERASGFWEYHGQAYRIPVMAAFVGLCASLALWPAQKNLGSLMSCSAAVMLFAQFWHAEQGGIYMDWYLPLLVLTIFRPNLEDRIATTAVSDSWLGMFRGRRIARLRRRVLRRAAARSSRPK